MPALTPPDPPLGDGAIALRGWRDRDLPALAAMASDPEIARWTRLPSPYGERDALEWITAQGPLMRRGEALPLAIVEAGDGALLGSIALRRRPDARGDIGYLVAAHARGRGVATRALRLLSGWSLDTLGLERLEVLVQPRNGASLAVAARAGYTREGVLRAFTEMHGKRVDLVMHSLLRGDERGR